MPSNYTYINSNSTATPSGAKTLIRVVINSKGATANTLTLKDGGTTFAVLDTTTAPGYVDFNVRVPGGLSAVMAGGTAADVTLVWE